MRGVIDAEALRESNDLLELIEVLPSPRVDDYADEVTASSDR